MILVCGGNTANLLAVRRVHGFDEILREAWESGVVLSGWSAGVICWFEASVTGSFGPQLAGMHDGLGFLPGSACPHYDAEELRRPVYTGLPADGFPPGLALDNAAAARFDGTELAEVVAGAPGAAGYLVGPAARSGSRRGHCRERQSARRRRLNSATQASVRNPIQIGVSRT